MKEQQYQMLVSQITSLIEGESDEIAVMSNVVAAIHQEMRFWWTGFYRAAGSLAATRDDYCSRCGAVPWSYRLQQCVAFGDCRAGV